MKSHDMTWVDMTLLQGFLKLIMFLFGERGCMTWHDMTWHDMAWIYFKVSWIWQCLCLEAGGAWHDMTWHEFTLRFLGFDNVYVWRQGCMTWHDMTWHEFTLRFLGFDNVYVWRQGVHDMTWIYFKISWEVHDMTWHGMNLLQGGSLGSAWHNMK